MYSSTLVFTFNTAREIDWVILIPFLVFAILLVGYLIMRNRKDEAKFEKEANKEIPESPLKEEIENGEM